MGRVAERSLNRLPRGIYRLSLVNGKNLRNSCNFSSAIEQYLGEVVPASQPVRWGGCRPEPSTDGATIIFRHSRKIRRSLVDRCFVLEHNRRVYEMKRVYCAAVF